MSAAESLSIPSSQYILFLTKKIVHLNYNNTSFVITLMTASMLTENEMTGLKDSIPKRIKCRLMRTAFLQLRTCLRKTHCSLSRFSTFALQCSVHYRLVRLG